MQRHDIWSRVEYDVKQARAHAPEGYEAVVRVFLAGQEPITLGFVETRRAADETWIRFEAAAPEVAEGEAFPAECYWVHAPEGAILGIEVRYQRAGAVPIGFRVGESDE